MHTLAPAYLPSISWFAHAAQTGHAHVGLQLNFEKQTPLSRTRIKGANGRLTLNAHVCRESRHAPIQDAILSHREHWVAQHIHSLQSAYGRTAFFEHYAPDILHILRSKPAKLLEMNLQLLEAVCGCLRIPITWHEEKVPQMILPTYQIAPYYQPFGAFAPELSVVDILFNVGPEAKSHLLAAKRTA